MFVVVLLSPSINDIWTVLVFLFADQFFVWLLRVYWVRKISIWYIVRLFSVCSYFQTIYWTFVSFTVFSISFISFECLPDFVKFVKWRFYERNINVKKIYLFDFFLRRKWFILIFCLFIDFYTIFSSNIGTSHVTSNEKKRRNTLTNICVPKKAILYIYLFDIIYRHLFFPESPLARKKRFFERHIAFIRKQNVQWKQVEQYIMEIFDLEFQYRLSISYPFDVACMVCIHHTAYELPTNKFMIQIECQLNISVY